MQVLQSVDSKFTRACVLSGMLMALAVPSCGEAEAAAHPVFAVVQNDAPVTASGETQADEVPAEGVPAEPVQSDSEGLAEKAEETASELADDTRTTVRDVATRIDQDPRAREAAAGILQPIYQVAEALAFPAFYWIAFSMMVAGVVSFALQLVLGKLMVLFRGSVNIREILSDAVGFLISAIGLVLTTQAATENSTFTQSAAGVLSATAVGAVAGLLLYSWGQSLELRAVDGQRLRDVRIKRKER